MANSAPTIETRKVPKAALAFAAGPLKLSAKAENGNSPVSVRARSGQPLNHWYWGKVVHDMAGFKAAAPSIPLDYCHEDDEILGYLDQFQPSNDGLDCDGQVVPFAPEDRASEILSKSGRGVPYQASIYFDMDSLVIEQLGPSATAQVNGYTLEGPAIIFRQWTLRGVAVCPYGYDPNTSTRLAAGGRLAGDVELSINQLSAPEADMSKETKPAETPPAKTELTPPPATPPAAVADPRAEFKATLEKFTAKFGPESGAKWAAEGLTYEAALDKHAEALAAQLTAEKAKTTELSGKLAAVPRGEAQPVSFSTPEKHEGGSNGQAKPGKFSNLGKLAAFAESIKLPGQK